MEDFTGFKFGETHTSDLGLLVVSDGSRYTKDLLPPIQDYTTEIPGGDGSYYFGSEYKSRQFNLNIAFDGLTELQLRQMKKTFSGKEIKDLIFDEEPYKVWKAKVSTPPNIQFICFDEDGRRVYKGEGTLSFTSFLPYAFSRYNYLNEYDDVLFSNISEWEVASGMKVSSAGYDSYDSISGDIKIFNAGDLDSDFTLEFRLINAPNSEISIQLDEVIKMKLDLIGKTGKVLFNTEKQIIKLDDVTMNGSIIDVSTTQKSEFFKIPADGEDHILNIGGSLSEVKISYKHRYL